MFRGTITEYSGGIMPPWTDGQHLVFYETDTTLHIRSLDGQHTTIPLPGSDNYLLPAGRNRAYVAQDEVLRRLILDAGTPSLEEVEGIDASDVLDVLDDGNQTYVCISQGRTSSLQRGLRTGGPKAAEGVQRSVLTPAGIFAQVNSGHGVEIHALDEDLNTRWKTSAFDRRKVDSAPLLANGVVVASAGHNEFNGSDELLVALDAENGRLLWQRDLSQPATPSVHAGRVFVADRGRMLVLDLRTGTELVNADSGCQTRFPTCIWGDDEHLFHSSKHDLRIFSPDGLHLLQRMETSGVLEQWCMEAWTLFDGAWYAPLAPEPMTPLKGTCSGLLRLEPVVDEKDAGLVVDPRPPIEITAVPDGKREAYRVEVRAESAEDLARYGAIVLKQAASRFGRAFAPSEETNRKFGGKLILAADLAAFGGEGSAWLEQLRSDVMERVDLYDMTGGDGKDPIHLEFQQL